MKKLQRRRRCQEQERANPPQYQGCKKCSAFSSFLAPQRANYVEVLLHYSPMPTVSFARLERARAADRIAVRGPDFARALAPTRDKKCKKCGITKLELWVPETAVGKLDQPPVPSAPSARPGRAAGGGGRAARGADLRAGRRPGKARKSPTPPPRAAPPIRPSTDPRNERVHCTGMNGRRHRPRSAEPAEKPPTPLKNGCSAR
eukprot:gene7274-biopygen3035